MAEQAVYARLSAIPALGADVHWLKLPQDVTYPAAKYQRIDAPRISASGEDIPDVAALIQVDIFARAAAGGAAFNSVCEAVRATFQRVSSPNSTPPITDVFIEGERDDYEDETDLLRKTFDFRIWYRE